MGRVGFVAVPGFSRCCTHVVVVVGRRVAVAEACVCDRVVAVSATCDYGDLVAVVVVVDVFEPVSPWKPDLLPASKSLRWFSLDTIRGCRGLRSRRFWLSSPWKPFAVGFPVRPIVVFGGTNVPSC